MEIYRRPRSTFWYVDIKVGERRIRKSLKTSDKHVARIRAKGLENEYVHGNLPAKHLPMQEFIDRYFNDHKGLVRDRTLTIRRLAMDNLLQFQQFKSINQITPVQCNEFVVWLSKKVVFTDKDSGATRTMKPVSVNSYVRNLRQIWTWAVNMGYATENVWKKIKPLKFQQPEVRVLSKKECSSMLKTADLLYPEYADLFRFYLLTGMRLSEALGLTWEDIDFHAKEISLTRTKTKFNRRVMMLPETSAILKRRSSLPRPFEYKDRWIKRIFKTIVTKSGIKYATIQDLRATTYSHLVSIGTPQALVRKIIGHTGDRIGQVHYFNMSTRDALKHVRKLGSITG